MFRIFIEFQGGRKVSFRSLYYPESAIQHNFRGLLRFNVLLSCSCSRSLALSFFLSLWHSHRHFILPATETVKFFIINIDFFFSSLYLVSIVSHSTASILKYSEYWIRFSNENEIMPSLRTRQRSRSTKQQRRKRISNKKKLIREIHNKFSMPFFPILFSIAPPLGLAFILLFDWHEIVCVCVCVRVPTFLHANPYEYHGKRRLDMISIRYSLEPLIFFPSFNCRILKFNSYDTSTPCDQILSAQ